MNVSENEKRYLELVMMKYGMRIETDSKGENVYNFNHFDRDGFKKNGLADCHRLQEILPIASSGEQWDFAASKFAETYKEAFLQELHRQSKEQHTEIPEQVLNLMLTAYLNGFNDGGNMAYKLINEELR